MRTSQDGWVVIADHGVIPRTFADTRVNAIAEACRVFDRESYEEAKAEALTGRIWHEQSRLTHAQRLAWRRLKAKGLQAVHAYVQAADHRIPEGDQ